MVAEGPSKSQTLINQVTRHIPKVRDPNIHRIVNFKSLYYTVRSIRMDLIRIQDVSEIIFQDLQFANFCIANTDT
jgi:hypothetical protein